MARSGSAASLSSPHGAIPLGHRSLAVRCRSVSAISPDTQGRSLILQDRSRAASGTTRRLVTVARWVQMDPECSASSGASREPTVNLIYAFDYLCEPPEAEAAIGSGNGTVNSTTQSGKGVVIHG